MSPQSIAHPEKLGEGCMDDGYIAPRQETLRCRIHPAGQIERPEFHVVLNWQAELERR